MACTESYHTSSPAVIYPLPPRAAEPLRSVGCRSTWHVTRRARHQVPPVCPARGPPRRVGERPTAEALRRGAGQARFGGRSGIQLDDVAAFQICSRFVDDSEGAYTSYELNVILRQPPGERITLLSHARQDSVRADAHQLAEFLDRPLVDHM